MWRYDSEAFDPPAPVVEADLVLGKSVHAGVHMQVDSGADLTCIPGNVVPASGALRYGSTYVSGFDGEISLMRTCFVTIRFGGHRFESVEVLPIAGEIGLLGRDLLNSLEVTLAGPARTLLIERP